MADPIVLVPADGAITILAAGQTSTSILVQGVSDPLASILYFIDGIGVGNSTADGTGIFSINFDVGLGEHQIWVTANGVQSNITNIVIAQVGYITITSPADGAEVDVPVGTPTHDFVVTGRATPRPDAVIVTLDGTLRPAVATDGSGNYTDTVAVPIGFHRIFSIFYPDGGSTQVASNVVAVTVLEEVTPPRPALLPDMSFTWYMNWLAGTLSDTDEVPPYTAQRAACILTGSPLDYTLTGALNKFAGNPPGQWLSVNTILNRQAGTSDLSDTDALYRICQAAV